MAQNFNFYFVFFKHMYAKCLVLESNTLLLLDAPVSSDGRPWAGGKIYFFLIKALIIGFNACAV